LLGTRPPIWRRLLLPAELTLDQLHSVLQGAVGWENYHMHDFRIGSQRFGKPDPVEKFMRCSATVSERGVRLSTVLNKIGAKAIVGNIASWLKSCCQPNRFVGKEAVVGAGATS
jgi:hypothetical protein